MSIDACVPQFKVKEIRHLSNMRTQDADITVGKRKAMTGHKTNQANEIYTHPSGSDTIDASQALSSFRLDKFQFIEKISAFHCLAQIIL